MNRLNEKFLGMAIRLGLTLEELLELTVDEVLRRMRGKVMN